MRTSILIDDELCKRLRREARRRGKSLSAFLAEAGRAALRQPMAETPPAFRLVTGGKGGVHSGVDLDRTGELTAADDIGSFRR